MKVLVVGTGGALVGSGITSAADQAAGTVAALGHDVERLVAGDRPRRRPNRLNLQNVGAVLGEALSVGRRARQLRPEVVWIHTFGVPALPSLRALLMVMAARASSRRVLLSLHAFELDEHVARGGRLLRAILRLTGRLASRLVVLREDDAAALRAAAPGAAVTILPNWVQVPAEAPSLPPGPPWRVAFVGSLTTRKGIGPLLDAAHLLADDEVVFRIVGGGGDEGPPAVAAALAAAGHLVDAGVVEFAGEVAPQQVRRELQAAHLFVLPSEAEGMPVALLEAMAEGRPVLVSDAGNMEEVVLTAQAGRLLHAVDGPAIAEAIRSLVGCGSLADLGRNAHRAAVERFSQARAAPEVEALLRGAR